MANPVRGSQGFTIVNYFQNQHSNLAAHWFTLSKRVFEGMPESEKEGVLSVVNLALMSFFTLASGHLNAAYSYCGMAVRLTNTLGLFSARDIIPMMANPVTKPRAQGLLQSLCVLDCFLATSLGRPPAVHKSIYASGPFQTVGASLHNHTIQQCRPDGLHSISSTFYAAQLMSETLEELYYQKIASQQVAEQIMERYNVWVQSFRLNSSSSASSGDPNADGQAVGYLHARLMLHHSVILLTRPFLLYTLVRPYQHGTTETVFTIARDSPSMMRLCEECITASNETIALIQAAFDAKNLSSRNPFMLYFLFSASIVILGNELAGVCDNVRFNWSIACATRLLEHSAQVDFRAAKFSHIFHSFLAVVKSKKQD
ncbi:Fungal specific transcription factor [Fusarium sp. LHS14.1]|nr:Fungal specific transcription factor [Fusarium sp. LHS14.1]